MGSRAIYKERTEMITNKMNHTQIAPVDVKAPPTADIGIPP
jgi:hypothetical protein